MLWVSTHAVFVVLLWVHLVQLLLQFLLSFLGKFAVGGADSVNFPNISTSFARDDILVLPIFTNDASSCRILSAYMSSFAAIVAFSIKDRYGILQL